jgi:hypothetical protein
MPNPDDRCFLDHVRGMFPRTKMQALRDHFLKVEEARGRHAASEREQKALLRGETSDAMRMEDLWYDLWRDPAPAILDAIRPFTWVLFPAQVRHVRAAVSHEVPWHQDIGYMRLHGARAHRQIITCFVPMEPDPSKCTTLQFSRDRTGELVHGSMNGFGAGLDGSRFNDLVHFDLAFGDALVFGDLVLHRTYTPPGAAVERRSFEFRLIRPEHALDNKDYFDVERGAFVRTDGSIRRAV